jgi:hypothetical protein
MREQFQKAFSDLTASSDLVRLVREKPELLREDYDLSDLEWRRLVGIVKQPGMEANCILYRANRLAPIVINLPDLCKELDADLRPLLSEYWVANRQLSDNFWVEANDFCEFVKGKVESGSVPETVLPALERERSVVAGFLAEIYPEKYGALSSAS